MSSSELPVGTVTFLFTDIEGSTQLLKQLRERYAEALGEHQRGPGLQVAGHLVGRREVVAQGEAGLDGVHVFFPDPWPKKRHHKRRFVQTRNLDQLARIMKPGALFRAVTDHEGYAAWIADRLALPMQYVRKKPKGFGRNALIEGARREGKMVWYTGAAEPLAVARGGALAGVIALWRQLVLIRSEARALHRVEPRVWQEPLGLGGRKSCATGPEWKRKLKTKAQELYPHLDVTLGNCDALLILHYATGGHR